MHKVVRHNIVKGVDSVITISATRAREYIYQLISDVNANCQPIMIINNEGKMPFGLEKITII